MKIMTITAVLAVALLIGWFWFPTELVAVGVPLLVFETCVLVSAVLDWREARLVVVGWRQAWAVAHATVFVRGWRRSRHIVRGLRAASARRAMRRHLEHAAPVDTHVVLDPTAPFTGRVINVDQTDASSDAQRAS